MAEMRQVPTMSVELAIQRELAYRKRVASMLPDAEAAKFSQGLRPLEMPSSSKGSNPDQYLRAQAGPSVVPRASHLKPGPQRSVMPLGGVSASHLAPMMASQLGGTSSLARPSLMHMSNNSGTKRKLTTSRFTWRPPKPPISSDRINTDKPMPRNYLCKVCQVSCSGSVSYKQHLRGHKHKAKQKFLQHARGSVGENEAQKPRCELCQIWCTDQYSLSLHFKGQKHEAKVQGLALGQDNVERQSAKRLWCELCQVPCTNEDTFELHLKGKNHAARAYAAEMKKKSKI